MSADLVFRSATVVDGNGGLPYVADVALKDGLIVRLSLTLRLFVSPGDGVTAGLTALVFARSPPSAARWTWRAGFPGGHSREGAGSLPCGDRREVETNAPERLFATNERARTTFRHGWSNKRSARIRGVLLPSS